MARYKALELSFVNNSLVQEGQVVEINDDPEDGGFTPSANFVKVDELDEPEPTKPARGGRRKSAAADDGDLA